MKQTPNLGLATTREIRDELNARVSVGHTDDNYRTLEPHEQFDYMAEADKTCSAKFNPQYVDRDSLYYLLQGFAGYAEQLNTIKKLFFRGKTPAEVGKVHPPLAVSCDAVFKNASIAEIDLLHGLIGVMTESGEMAEVLLKRLDTGSFDHVNAFEECGDVSWYLARQLRGLKTDFDTMQRANIDKLHGRHGDAFNQFRDSNRDLNAERAKLEATAPLFDTQLAIAETSEKLSNLPPAWDEETADDDRTHGDDSAVNDDPVKPDPFVGSGRVGGAPAPLAHRDPPGVERYTRKPVGDVPGDCG